MTGNSCGGWYFNVTEMAKNTHKWIFQKVHKSAIPCYYWWWGKGLRLPYAGSSPALGTILPF